MSDHIQFRAMTSNDLAAVVVNENNAFSHPWSMGVFSDCLLGDYDCWVVLENDQVIGHGILSVAAGECHLLNVCITPQQQGRGLGRLLVEHLLEQATRQDAARVYLEVRPSNQVARELYKSMGFDEIGRRKGYYPAETGREDAVVLTRALID
jgi:ribosomal-protein-alanine N-acetyltransferase